MLNILLLTIILLGPQGGFINPDALGLTSADLSQPESMKGEE